MEDNKNKHPKHKLKVLRYKRKATPSKVKDDKNIDFNTNIVPMMVIRKTHLYIIGKKAINTAVLKVRAKKAFIIKTKANKLKTLWAKQWNIKSATSSATMAFLSKNPQKCVKVDPNISKMTGPDNKYI